VTEQTDLADRYGAADPWRRRVLVLGCLVVVLAFVAWLTWVIWSQSTPEVDSEMIGYDVQGEHAAVATVEVRLADEDVEASCTLRAYAEDHSVVGELVFTPDSSGTTERSVRTERLATSVELVGCTAPGQNRRR